MRLPKVTADQSFGISAYSICYGSTTAPSAASQIELQTNGGGGEGESCKLSTEDIRKCARAVAPIYQACLGEGGGKLSCAYNLRKVFSAYSECKPCIEFSQKSMAAVMEEIQNQSSKQ